MASDKRDFSNFKEFPGGIVKTGKFKGCYAFPDIISEDSLKRKRIWRIYIRLIKSTNNKTPARRKINWDLAVDKSVPIIDSHFESFDLKDTIAQIWTITGILSDDEKYKLTSSIPTYVIKGKNIGRINETNIFTQALINARAKYLKKKQESEISKNRFFPVAVHKYDASPKDKSKHIVYPVAVQRKLDGGRAVAFWDDKSKKTVLYTRKLKDLCGNENIVNELNSLFKEIHKKYPLYKSIYLDGEIYKHGMSLQEISGIMRRELESNKKKPSEKNLLQKPHLNEMKDNEIPKLEYHIFDIFFPLDDKKLKEMSMIERQKVLDSIFKIFKSNKLIKPVETFIAKTKEEETKLYEKFLKEKYEGSIVKNLHSPYEFGTNREIRSYQMRKRKPRYSAEYEIVGYTEGEQGKDKGAIIWILKTKGTKEHPSKQFTSTPVGMNYEERYKMFKDMTPEKFKKKYLGKMMTVEYDDISIDGVPLRAKAKCIRVLD